LKIFGISGSLKKSGNTEFLRDKAITIDLERRSHLEKLLCSELRVGFCINRGDCTKGKICPLDDDIIRVHESMEEADGLVVAFPPRRTFDPSMLNVRQFLIASALEKARFQA
jgi:multimeric flavodoxin WrbA